MQVFDVVIAKWTCILEVPGSKFGQYKKIFRYFGFAQSALEKFLDNIWFAIRPLPSQSSPIHHC